MQLIDIGINLMHRSFDRDREGVILAAENAGVSPLIITGASEQDSQAAARFAAQYGVKNPGKIYTTAGVHPHGAKNWTASTADTLRKLAAEDALVAIGECGLDYNRDFSPRPVQRSCFEAQVSLAAELGMPLFLHCRDAFDDFAAILRNSGAPVKNKVVHCFTGTADELATYLELGCFIGITGWICDERRGRHLADLVKMIPPDRLMVETDAPFLMPRDLPADKSDSRFSRNESKYLVHILRAIAGHLGRDPEQLARETYANTVAFFNLPKR
ncbi:TatD family hydrolase [Treponema primitia]|uniref:TatD family hydrolase n=1 Tax=Treponema primitia TaxID=88058 RepID=UPI00398166B4